GRGRLLQVLHGLFKVTLVHLLERRFHSTTTATSRRLRGRRLVALLPSLLPARLRAGWQREVQEAQVRHSKAEPGAEQYTRKAARQRRPQPAGLRLLGLLLGWLARLLFLLFLRRVGIGDGGLLVIDHRGLFLLGAAPGLARPGPGHLRRGGLLQRHRFLDR